MTAWSPGPGLAAYRDGVTIICEIAALFTAAQWAAITPCGDWRAADIAGHLRCMADDYHEYLDDAPDSRLARLMGTGFPAATLARKQARQNAAELAELPDVPAPEHIAAFAEAARSYADRVPPVWDRPHHGYRGTVVTVGAMAGVACGEWHVHAWDLARSLGMDYRPGGPGAGLRRLVGRVAPAPPGRGRGPAGRGPGRRRRVGDAAERVRPRPALARLTRQCQHD